MQHSSGSGTRVYRLLNPDDLMDTISASGLLHRFFAKNLGGIPPVNMDPIDLV